MLIVQVRVHVKPECVEGFRFATLANAQSSLQEPGIARFDVLQQVDDSSRFLLTEVYRTREAIAAHKETEHYRIWRDTVAPMMAEPRASTQYVNIHPGDDQW